MDFSSWPLADGTLDAIAALGFDTPTPIQAQAIGPLLSGRDVVGQARTGSGKTAAFGIPMVDALRAEHRDVQGLVLVPTRELAIQVTEVLGDLARGSRLAVVPIYGGAGFGQQNNALGRTGAKIVVATPGRLLDHIERRTLALDKVRFLVLDEADRMLDMGFIHDMRRVLRLVPQRRQTALFSATLSDEIRRLVKEFTADAIEVRVDTGDATPDAEQFVAQVEKAEKAQALLGLLHTEQPARAIVFTRTKHLAKRLAQRLCSKGWAAVALQGNMTQGQRERAMAAFREGSARILVATDVAARGLDIPEVSHVVNFDLPDPDQYVHRIGRTARNGATGRAFTFVQSDEARDLKAIERRAGSRLETVKVALEEAPAGPDPVREAPQGGGHGRPGASGRGPATGRAGYSGQGGRGYRAAGARAGGRGRRGPHGGSSGGSSGGRGQSGRQGRGQRGRASARW